MDIVGELRSRADESELCRREYANTPQLMRAAATEIARLREGQEALREALVAHNCGTPGCLCYECCRAADVG